MKRLILSIAAALVFCALGPVQSARAGEEPNILVMGDDWNPASVPRSTRVFKQVLDALSEELNREGFAVYDEIAVSLDDFRQNRVRRTDAELIDIARSVKRPPIDVAVIFSIFASTSKTNYTTKIRTRVTGRLLNVRSGKRLGNFEVDLPRSDNVSPNCNRECILETVGSNAKSLALDLGVVLAQKLAWLIPAKEREAEEKTEIQAGLSTAFSLTFKGFTADDISRIEEYMVAFKGYRHHRPVKSSLRTNEYWYETDSDTARLNRNLRRMIDHMGLTGRVTFSGSTFVVENISPNKQR
ncbi:MAG: hypothetical protein CMM77_00365 [Rhodospirillaceae bacterium]|jgi:hypothetical protein|nr:hypothetical protein [Rhodospirillaceae bacterium]